MNMAACADGYAIGATHVRQPEIQGLRAIAVLAVIWAHAGLPGLPGGFTGVDVFFVISGFLITRLLLRELESSGGIDLLAFWARRARRLLPNACAALVGTLLLALFVFPGYSPERLVSETTFAALEVVNFLFAKRAVDYFQAGGPSSPLLHFWSLSVEEQFYFLWPLVLAGIGLLWRAKRRSRIVLALCLIWCASFVANIVISFTEQPTAYFSTGTRCWQLATGALLAASWQGIERLPNALRGAMAWGGLAAIAVGMAAISEGASYPGWLALLPTLGTAAIIAGFGAASKDGALRWGLSSQPAQWIGERSYSWYLWHWPLLALPRIAYPEIPHIEMFAIPASLVVACAAYAWIEVPFRHGRNLAGSSRTTLAHAAVALCAVIAVGQAYQPALYLVDRQGVLRAAQIDAVIAEQSQAVKNKCQLGRKRLRQPDCLYGDTSAPRRAVLFGDSHAMHWFEPLNIAAKQTKWQLQVWTKSGCPASDVTLNYSGQIYSTCDEWREAMMTRLTGPGRPDLVVISQAAAYAPTVYDVDARTFLSASQGKKALQEGLGKNLRRLLAAGVRVAVIHDIPTADKNYRACLARSEQCTRPRGASVAEPPLSQDMHLEFAGRITALDFTDSLCDAAVCSVVRDGIVAYHDPDHLTVKYAATFAPQMAALLRGLDEGSPVTTASTR